jgi:two-component system, chemotaxis family, protein-glutamate methylesterase/glutaminase
MEKNDVTRPCGILLIGGSAGSLEVLFKLLPRLKPDLSFPIVLVLHRRSSSDSSLTDLLSSKTTNITREVDDKDPVTPGVIYLAPPDYHLLLEQEHYFSLDYSEKVNFSRPSIDVTFESAADVYASSTVGILLSGANEDGTEGLIAIKKAGGRTIAQDPATAQMPFMPHHAITHSEVDHVFDLTQLAAFVNSLVGTGSNR